MYISCGRCVWYVRRQLADGGMKTEEDILSGCYLCPMIKMTRAVGAEELWGSKQRLKMNYSRTREI
jgi:hypothetical protein